jgi:hypothetical protein
VREREVDFFLHYCFLSQRRRRLLEGWWGRKEGHHRHHCRKAATMWEREGGGGMTTTTMARGGRGCRADNAILSVVAVCRRNKIDGCWRGVGGVGRDVVVVTAIKLQD